MSYEVIVKEYEKIYEVFSHNKAFVNLAINTNDNSYSIAVDPEKIDMTFVNNIKYLCNELDKHKIKIIFRTMPVFIDNIERD